MCPVPDQPRLLSPLLFHPAPCCADSLLPLLPPPAFLTVHPPFVCHAQRGKSPAYLPVGALICHENRLMRVVGRAFFPGVGCACPLLRALTDWPEEKDDGLEASVSREGWAVACVTLSDKGWLSEREDRSGPRLLELVRHTLPICHEQGFLLPDDPAALRALVIQLVDQGYDLVLTSGGTGLSPRDLTPEALLPILDRRLPGFEQQMMTVSLTKTPHAALSRALAGTVGSSLILTLPGSVRGAGENLEAVLPALPHALEKLAGDRTDCGG